jgi:hypothetical protein
VAQGANHRAHLIGLHLYDPTDAQPIGLMETFKTASQQIFVTVKISISSVFQTYFRFYIQANISAENSINLELVRY